MVAIDEDTQTGQHSSGIAISPHLSPTISIADYNNGVSLFHALSIKNPTDQHFELVELRIVSDPPIFSSRSWRIDSITANTTHPVHDLSLEVDPRVLQRLTERENAVLEFTLRSTSDDLEIATKRVELGLLPRNHWSGLASHLPEVIAAFVQPNDPKVDQILKLAAGILQSDKRPASFNGYADGSGHAWEVANAIWNAVSSLDFTYIYPPASFEETGQKVRTPDGMMQSRMGTCLDLTVLFAALMEQASLNTVIVFTQGHAFPGFWLKPKTLTARIEDDPSQIRNHLNLKDLVLFESTLVTNRDRAIPFSEAISAGSRKVSFDNNDDFILAVDIKQARNNGIRPIASLDASDPESDGAGEQTNAPLKLESIPQDILSEPELTEEVTDDSPGGRLDRWQRKLLDLSLRNRLLNFRTSKKTLRVELGSASIIEDTLSSGQKLKFDPTPDMAHVRSDESQARLEALSSVELSNEVIHQALQNRSLLVKKTREDIDAGLIGLYRDARLALEEGGSNILYLAFGYLSWTPARAAERSYLAPLLLVPVVIERKSARTGFTIQAHDDGARINSTLIQLLKQDHNLHLPISDDDLPQDDQGIDVESIWRKVRQAIGGMRGWEVVERIDLATFSFSKYLMWKDMVDRTDSLKRNLVVRQLLNGTEEAFADQEDFPKEESLDTSYTPDSVFTPLPADSSQLATVLAVSKGKSFVVIGPPGTGKSQTISNIISQTLAEGKTVLFVSEKIAALDVVHRRLREVGLGDFCLELHSNKANKKGVLAQLGNAWHKNWGSTHEGNWEAHSAKLESVRRDLNEYVSELHKVYPNNFSLFAALGRIASGNEVHATRLDLPPSPLDSYEHYQQMEMAASRLQHQVIDLPAGSLQNPSLLLVGAESWSLPFQTKAHSTASAINEKLKDSITSLAELNLEIGTSTASWSTETVEDFMQLAEVLVSTPETPLPSAARPGAVTTIERIRGGRSTALALQEYDHALAEWWTPPTPTFEGHPLLQELHDAVTTLSVPYGSALASFDLAQCATDWHEAGDKFFLFRGRAQKKVQQHLAAVTINQSLPDVSNDLPILESILRLKTLLEENRTKLQSEMDRYSDLGTGAPDLWKGAKTSLEHLQWATSLAESLETGLRNHSLETQSAVHTNLAEILDEGGARRSRLVSLSLNVRKSVALLDGLRNQFLDALSTSPEKRTEFETRDLKTQAEISGNFSTDAADLRTWCAWRSARREATESGLSVLVNLVDSGQIEFNCILESFQVNYAREWAMLVSDQSNVIREFIGSNHERKIQSFRELDKIHTELTAEIVKLRVLRSTPDPNIGTRSSEAGILRRELEKKTKHKPIRRLMEDVPNLITGITPCFMMSPLSIAQYLSPDTDLFDVVVFDEASQIPVWDAVGAIARGKQVIMVGDQKQLPPTSFFDRAESDEELDDDLVDLQSILDECVASNMPSRKLNWHYRSRHESLIAFSNRKYYDGELITFPSPVTEDTAVSSRFVGGVYQRGSAEGQKNPEEAQVVVEEVVQQLKTHPDQSVGVVTFNMKQKEEIDNLLDKARRDDPSLEQFFDTERIEPVMVKNLESVQGDERDVMFFSTTFGRDSAGKMYMNFGPLTKTGGERRLNVAITRARRQLRVITSIRPEDIDLSRTSSLGVADFKVFLDYASRGVAALDAEIKSRGGISDSPFEEAVAKALRIRGWNIQQQIGVSGYRIDLAVVHPDAPGAFLAGIECDGASYHSTATARDRDQIREAVLRGLGWEILRVWSTDWFYNEKSVVDSLHAKLDDLLTKQRSKILIEEANAFRKIDVKSADVDPFTYPKFEETSESETTDESIDSDQLIAGIEAPSATPFAEPTAQNLPSARHAMFYYADVEDFTLDIDPEEFYSDSYSPVLVEMIAFIVDREGPIREDDLVVRVRSWHGWGRTGSRIREQVLKTVPNNVSNTIEEDGTVFYWSSLRPPAENVEFRQPADKDNRRSVFEISIPELSWLAKEVVHLRIDNETRIRQMQDAIGLARLSTSARARLQKALESAGKL